MKKTLGAYYIKIIRHISQLFVNPHFAYRKFINITPVSISNSQSFLQNINLNFIVSTGRTGTVWLSQLLKNNEKTYSIHEPVILEAWAHKEACKDSSAAENYIKNFKTKDLYFTIPKNPSIKFYCEVNGNLRRHIEPIYNTFPNVKIIHIVRSGKDVVRSVMSRGTLSGNHPVYYDFSPPIVDSYSRNWEKLTEFQKSCWLWSWENKYMREKCKNRIRFEDMLSSYADFKTQLLDVIGIDIPEKAWSKSKTKPLNITQTHKMNSWHNWTTEQQEQFCEICGDEMQHYGYEI